MSAGPVNAAAVVMPRPVLSDRSLVALAILNFFLADSRDGLGPFLDAFLATHGWSAMSLGVIATVGGLIGLLVTPLCGALVDGTPYKRALIAIPVIILTGTALVTLAFPEAGIVWIGQVGTAVVGAVIGPALTGLTLGLVGERLFSRQVSRNEFWNHAGNVASVAAVFALVTLFGQSGVIGLMTATAIGTLAAVFAISPRDIDHKVARGLARDDGKPGPSGFSVLLQKRGLVALAVILLVFHFGNAPMSRLIAQQFSIELGTPFRTTAIITGISQVSMIAMAVAAPFIIRRFGVGAVILVALLALPVRGLLAGAFSQFWVVFPVQILDGIGAGLIGIATPIAVERLLSGTGRFNVGLAAVMTVQGIGASLSNVVAGWLTSIGGYGLSHYAGGGIAVLAVVLFLMFRADIVVAEKTRRSEAIPAAPEPAL